MINSIAILSQLGYTRQNGLCYNIDEAKNEVERLYMDEVRKLGVNAVYFRRYYYEDNEMDTPPFHSQPAVCILERSESFFNTEEHHKLHAALWSAGNTEIYIISSPTRIDIINARIPAKASADGVVISKEDENLVLANEVLSEFNDFRFAAHLFGSGTFWEQSDFTPKIDGNSSPYLFLRDYLMFVRAELSSNSNLVLSDESLDKLLIICVLVKFLEELRDEEERCTLDEIYQKYEIKSFADALESGYGISIIEELSNEFNGKVFDAFTNEEKDKINKTNLSLIAQFLRANINPKTGQYFLWEQYSFQHLPAEVISAIYENFIQFAALREKGKSEKGVVYTPIHLVNLLIDEVMPLSNAAYFKENKFKILDPACGSGMFLVAAYKRLLQWWTINNYEATGQIEYPNKEVAQKILEDNIFGIDIEPTAVLVSVFGLTTALLDKLTPKEIWNNLKFKDLKGKNIKAANFIDWAKQAKESKEQYDLVIGNPPFNASSKGGIDNKEFERLFETKVPRNKLALKFLEGAFYFGKRVCMIMPSSILLYNRAKTSQQYRNQLFTTKTIERIYDFTHLRESLFVKKNSTFGKNSTLSKKEKNKKTGRTPVVALIADNKPSEYQSIEHIIVKRELYSEKKVRFEIDYYDRHLVRWDWATNEKMQFVWKANLLGGGRLFHLMYRLSLLRTLKEYIKEKEKEDSEWIYRSGYKIGGNTEKKPAEFVSDGHKIMSVDENGQYTVDKNGEYTNMFESSPPAISYIPPFLVFDQVIGDNNIPTAFIKEYKEKKYLYFNRDFVGIHAPINRYSDLVKIYNNFTENHGKLYRMIALINSGSAMVLTETEINKRDIDKLPFPHLDKNLILSFEEKIIQNDVLNYYIHLGKSINPKKSGHILHQNISTSELKGFGKVFCNTMNEVYANKGKSWQTGKLIETPTFIKYQFGFGIDGGLNYKYEQQAGENIIDLLEDAHSNQGAIHKRVIRYYKHENGYDCLYLIKPKARRYWLKSIALRDADDTFMDLKKAGY